MSWRKFRFLYLQKLAILIYYAYQWIKQFKFSSIEVLKLWVRKQCLRCRVRIVIVHMFTFQCNLCWGIRAAGSIIPGYGLNNVEFAVRFPGANILFSIAPYPTLWATQWTPGARIQGQNGQSTRLNNHHCLQQSHIAIRRHYLVLN